MLANIYGAWEVHDRAGRKRCRAVLERAPAIGGNAITVDPGCGKLFPVTDRVASWSLLEGWVIQFNDALRKPIMRFSTPDARYVATPGIDGIVGIRKPSEKPAPAGRR